MTRKDAERQEYTEKLRSLLKPGDTVFTTVKHVSRSGMMRSIDVHIIQDSKPIWLSYWVAKACGEPFDERHESVKMSGCGMDMGFALVYNLSRILFPDGFGVKGEFPLGHEIRPETKRKAVNAVKKGAKFYGRNGDVSGWDDDGGYALKQEWM